MAAYGLYSHIQSNKRRSVALLISLFLLVYVLVYAGAALGEALGTNAPLDIILRRAVNDTIAALPWATAGTVLWIIIAYKFHQSMIDALTGGREVTRRQEPRLYNLLENLCISRGITMPKLKIADEPALNAFATGMNEKQYSITVTSGLLESLDDAEIEAVLGHELTHIRNGDVRMMVIAVIIAGVVSFFAELVFRLWFWNGFGFGRGRSSGDRRGELPGATSAVMEMCIDNPREGFGELFDTHPTVDSRVAALVKFAGGHDPGPIALPPQAGEPADQDGDMQDSAPGPASPGPWGSPGTGNATAPDLSPS